MMVVVEQGCILLRHFDLGWLHNDRLLNGASQAKFHHGSAAGQHLFSFLITQMRHKSSEQRKHFNC
jgi:hypothetical protein